VIREKIITGENVGSCVESVTINWNCYEICLLLHASLYGWR